MARPIAEFVSRVCPICNDPFIAKTTRHKYCTPGCYNKMRRSRYWTRRQHMVHRVRKDQLVAALERADTIIDWMSHYVGAMTPPADGLGELNEHWIFMERHCGKRYKRFVQASTTRVDDKDGKITRKLIETDT